MLILLPDWPTGDGGGRGVVGAGAAHHPQPVLQHRHARAHWGGGQQVNNHGFNFHDDHSLIIIV